MILDLVRPASWSPRSSSEFELELDRLKKKYRDEDDQFPELKEFQDR